MSDYEHFDFVIIGGGLSGVGAAVYYMKQYPGANKQDSSLYGSQKKFAIFEGRSDIGGTWDLFKYPGIRSDSAMTSFAFSFKPWLDHSNSIAPGEHIKEYISQTSDEFGVTPNIRFRHRAKRMNWDSKAQQWIISFEKSLDDNTTETVTVTAKFLQMCTGYYKYENGYTPTTGPWSTLKEDFRGDVIHPQHWPEKYNYDGKRVVVIGSGATAITLVPVMAQRASHVTMLQRSPTYMISLPTAVQLPFVLRWLPVTLAAKMLRFANIIGGWLQFVFCKAFPDFVAAGLRKTLSRVEGVPDADIKKHFTPKYNVWDERFCVVANGDLFAQLRAKKASVVTGTIDRFVENGIRLNPEAPGVEPVTIEADVIVTATGLEVQLFGGASIEIDGVPLDLCNHIVYRGTMLSGVPNFALSIGYTNASWTLKIELAFHYVMRLLRHMDANGKQVVTPTPPSNVAVTDRSVFDLASNYVRRAKSLLPRQGSLAPWIVLNSYPKDYFQMAYGSLRDANLVYK